MMQIYFSPTASQYRIIKLAYVRVSIFSLCSQSKHSNRIRLTMLSYSHMQAFYSRVKLSDVRRRRQLFAIYVLYLILINRNVNLRNKGYSGTYNLFDLYDRNRGP